MLKKCVRTKDHLHIIMELVEGGSLLSVLKKKGPQSEEVCLFVYLFICLFISFVHLLICSFVSLFLCLLFSSFSIIIYPKKTTLPSSNLDLPSGDETTFGRSGLLTFSRGDP